MCIRDSHSGVLIEKLGYLYNDSLENLRHLLGNLGKLEETFTMEPWKPREHLQCNLGNLENLYLEPLGSLGTLGTLRH